MTTTLRVSDPQELLALIPYQLGFVPQESLAVVSLQGAHQRVGLMARCELTELATDHGARLAGTLVNHCLTDNANKLVLVFFCDQGQTGAVQDQVSRAVKLFRAVAKDRVEIDSIWIVGPQTYYSWFSVTKEQCDPHCGNQCAIDCADPCLYECYFHLSDGRVRERPVSDFQGTEISAHMVVNGLSYRKSRAELGKIVPASKAEREKTAASFRRHEYRQFSNRVLDGRRKWELETLERWTQMLEALGYQAHTQAGCRGNNCAVDPDPGLVDLRGQVTATQYGKIASGLKNRRVRDAILLSMTPGGAPVAAKFLYSDLDRCMCGPDGSAVCINCSHPVTDPTGESLVNDALALIVSPARGIVPTTCQLEIVTALLTDLIAHTRTVHCAAPYALLTLAYWWRGNGAAASRFNEEALKIEPNYRLAALLESVLDAGLAPGWARRVNR